MTSRIFLIGSSADIAALGELGHDAARLSVVAAGDAIATLHAAMPSVVVLMVETCSAGAQARREGLRLLARLTADPVLQAVPVLALLPNGDSHGLVTALELGAADCAMLPLAAGEGAARIDALLRRKLQADQAAAEQRVVRRLATLDAVTGVFNRHYLDGRLNATLAQARATGAPLSVLMVDIDAFKPINDRFGHATGDRALAAIAARLVANVRAVDTVARFGGDELAVVMPDTDMATAWRVAERLRAAVAAAPVTGSNVRLTVSIGVATLQPGDADGTALLSRADVALYDAKRSGRNRVAEAA